MSRAKLDRNGEVGRKALGMGNCSTNIWDGSELKLAWSKKSSSPFENNFPICLSSGISNKSIFTVLDVLHWVNFLGMKISSIFRSTFCWDRQYLNIFGIPFIFYYCQQIMFTSSKSFFFTITIKWCFCWYCSWCGFFSVFTWSWIYITIKFISPLQQTLTQNHRSSHKCYSVKIMLKLVAFKWLLNELLVKTEWSDVMLIWWFVWIKLIRSFLKVSFLICLFKRFAL